MFYSKINVDINKYVEREAKENYKNFKGKNMP